MNKRIVFSVAATSVLAASAVTVASASTSRPAASPNITRPQTVHLYGYTNQRTDIDVGAKGMSPGDEFVVTQGLFKDGYRVGNDSIVNTFTNNEGASQCVFTMNLPDGQVTGQVLIAARQKSFVAAVTGGSRRYQNSRGQVQVQLLPSGNIRFTVQLIP